MAELSTLARPYARAAFESAAADNSLQQWADALVLLAGIAVQDKVAALIQAPSLTVEQKADALLQLCGDEVGGKTANFVTLLAENHRLGLLPQVHEQFHALKTEREKVVDVELISAIAVDAAQQEKLARHWRHV